MGIVDSQTHAVVAEHHLAVATTIDRRKMLVACDVNMLEFSTFRRTNEHTLVRSSQIEVAVFVLTESAHRCAFCIGIEIALDVLPVIFQQSLVTGNEPDMSLLVFFYGIDGMDIA